MNSVTSTVIDLWDFLIPPLLKIALVLALTAWLTRPLLVGLVGSLQKAAGRVRSEAETEPLLKALGLEKLVPGIALFLFVLLVYAGNEVILGLGWRLPLDIRTTQPASLLHLTSKERLLVLWSQHPDVELYDLPIALENDLLRLRATHSPDILSNVKYWEQTSAATTRWFYTVKFLIIYSVLVCIVAIRRVWEPRKAIWRAVLLILVLAIVLVLLAGHRLYCHDQLLQAKYSVIASSLPEGQLEQGKMELLKERLKRARMSYAQIPWWEISTFETYPWIQGIKHLTGRSRYLEQDKLE